MMDFACTVIRMRSLLANVLEGMANSSRETMDYHTGWFKMQYDGPEFRQYVYTDMRYANPNVPVSPDNRAYAYVNISMPGNPAGMTSFMTFVEHVVSPIRDEIDPVEYRYCEGHLDAAVRLYQNPLHRYETESMYLMDYVKAFQWWGPATVTAIPRAMEESPHGSSTHCPIRPEVINRDGLRSLR